MNKDNEKVTSVVTDNEALESNENSNKLSPDTELEVLKNYAKGLGVKFSENIGIAKLKERIESFMYEKLLITKIENQKENTIKETQEVTYNNKYNNDDDDGELNNVSALESTSKGITANKVKKTSKEKAKDALKLVRFTIKTLDPNMSSTPSISVTITNSDIPPMTKVIPLNTDTPWHAPRMMVDHLKSLTFIEYRKEAKNAAFSDFKHPVEKNKFLIAELPPLTPSELEALKERQIKENTGRAE